MTGIGRLPTPRPSPHPATATPARPLESGGHSRRWCCGQCRRFWRSVDRTDHSRISISKLLESYAWIIAPLRPLAPKKRPMIGLNYPASPPPKGWPDGRGISGRMPVERVAECSWNQWPNGRGIRSNRGKSADTRIEVNQPLRIFSQNHVSLNLQKNQHFLTGWRTGFAPSPSVAATGCSREVSAPASVRLL